jgi:hypothetical protein
MSHRIELACMSCPGEGYRSHLFVDGKYIMSIPGHSCDPESLRLFRHWSEVSQSTILFRGRELKEADPDGYICSEDFRVVTNHPGDKLIPMQRKTANVRRW